MSTVVIEVEAVVCTILLKVTVTTDGSAVVASLGKLPDEVDAAPACSLVSSMDPPGRLPPDPTTDKVLDGDNE